MWLQVVKPLLLRGTRSVYFLYLESTEIEGAVYYRITKNECIITCLVTYFRCVINATEHP